MVYQPIFNPIKFRELYSKGPETYSSLNPCLSENKKLLEPRNIFCYISLTTLVFDSVDMFSNLPHIGTADFCVYRARQRRKENAMGQDFENTQIHKINSRM